MYNESDMLDEVNEKNTSKILEEAMDAIKITEYILSEDVLNAITREFAVDNCIYDAINKLKDVMAKYNRYKKERV